MSHLTTMGEVADPRGMASTVLAEAVGYPGSSVAFAQLLSGMERSGLIEREIRGKRTYRIAAAPEAADGAGGRQRGGEQAREQAREQGRAGGARQGGARSGRVAARDAAGPPAGQLVAAEPGELDYDELARRLLMQVVQRLVAAPPEAAPLAGSALAGSALAGSALAGSALAGPALEGTAGDAGLQQTVASLEQKLASVQSKQRRLTAENAKLREQLRAAQRSLAEAQERAAQGGQLDTAEVRLLERLLSPLRQPRAGREEAGAS